MDLFLVRHAEAEDGVDDDARALTRRGKRRFRQAVAGLGAVGVSFDRLVHSPKRRALETAELLSPLLDGEMELCPDLAEPCSEALLKRLKGLRVAAVGHEPFLSELVAWLVCDARALASHFELKKGAVAWLEGDAAPGRMTLRALLPVRVLRRAR